jgi:hypothetical protein
MEERSGVEELEAWLRSLVPRAELVARMALRSRFRALGGEKGYFARIAMLIKELDLSPEDLARARADAQCVAAYLGSADRKKARLPGKGAEPELETAALERR